jgi:hypothetical protein
MAVADRVAENPTWSPVWLVLAGNLIVFGSFTPWDICPDSSCHRGGLALMALWPTSGVEFGPGVATVILGVALLGSGLLWSRSRRYAGLVAIATGALTIATCMGFYLRMHVLTEER